MRILALVFALLIVALQYPMWLGKGGWLQVRELDRQIERQQHENERHRGRNEALEAEVRDLKQGVDAIEERARAELGMVKRDEVFFMVQEPAPAARDAEFPAGVVLPKSASDSRSARNDR